MNHRYKSNSVLTEGDKEPEFKKDKELFYQPTTYPGARIPHAWVYDKTGVKHSLLDLCGKGNFSIFTGIGGEEWLKAAKNIETQLGIKIQCNIIGPDQDFEDHAGEWSTIREISDSGLILVRPDQHICWRSKDMISNSSEKLMDVMKKILHKR